MILLVVVSTVPAAAQSVVRAVIAPAGIHNVCLPIGLTEPPPEVSTAPPRLFVVPSVLNTPISLGPTAIVVDPFVTVIVSAASVLWTKKSARFTDGIVKTRVAERLLGTNVIADRNCAAVSVTLPAVKSTV
ncbi:hypothetical protein CIT26_30895 [Mesorhizobium temperatum]|uniref:Uncharacterized protein n=1 Tax=Mesorhizobium temperatum TaxID=241416 RepID=A0A271LAR3_9HYPH|nr:hypothetical protein CIT26_30895 [Mesorhizobium temperatum]